ncbi:MAG: helix-turn-helix transcriptional regulator [Mobilitalea sp.]
MSEEEIRKIFSRNLTNLLEDRNKSQKDLVDFIGVSSSTVSNWCTGQKLPRMDKVQQIANWLGVNNSDLLETKKNETQITYDEMIRIYTRSKNGLTPQEKMKLAKIILSDDEG